MTVSTVIIAAEAKFGTIVNVVTKGKNNYRLAIKRDQPAREDMPFMTITGYIDNTGKAAFEHGHYDLTEARLNETFPN